MNNQILVLAGKNAKMFISDVEGACFVDIYNRKLPKIIIRIFRNLWMIKFSLGKWIKNIRGYKTIILFDGESNLRLVKWILKKKCPETRLIFYYRNSIASVRSEISPNNLKKLNLELWSYNLHDCEKYGLRYNSQVLDGRFFESTKESGQLLYDAIFIGYSKDRKSEIKTLKKKLDDKGIKSCFFIPDAGSDWLDPEIKKAEISYDEYVSVIRTSKSIIDIVSESNYGLTLRPLEALYLKKKLITNYYDIKRYDFYSKENIFIFSEDNIEDIEGFISAPYKSIEGSVVSEYQPQAWVNNFFMEV